MEGSPEPLERRLERRFKESMHPPSRPLENLVEEVWDDEAFGQLFLLFKVDPLVRRLLVLHRSDLFGLDQNMPVAFHVRSKDGISLAADAGESRALFQMVSPEAQFFETGDAMLQDFLGLDPQRWDDVKFDIADVLLYFALLYARSNKEFRELLLAKDFDYASMKRVVRNYSGLGLAEFAEGLSLGPEKTQIDPAIVAKIESLFLNLVSIAGLMVDAQLEGGGVLPDLRKAVALTSGMWVQNALSKARLTLPEYLSVVDALHAAELLRPGSILFWCENCALESPHTVQYSGRIAPSKLQRDKCLNCSKAMSFAGALVLDPLLKEVLLSKDGLLAVYLGWLLKAADVPFETSIYGANSESDFFAKGVLLECKTLKQDRDIQALRSAIFTACVQIEQQLREHVAAGKRVTRTVLVWNREELPKELEAEVRTRFPDLTQRYNLAVVGPNQLPELVQAIKSGR